MIESKQLVYVVDFIGDPNGRGQYTHKMAVFRYFNEGILSKVYSSGVLIVRG